MGRRQTAAFAVAALAVRLAHLAFLRGSPLFRCPVVDASWHHQWAELVAGGSPLAYAPYFRAPLYPWLLGAVYRLTGSSLIVGACLSALMAAVSTALLHRIALRASRSARVAAFCALAWALWGTDVLYSTSLLITPLYILLLLTAFLQTERRGISAWPALGLAAIARPTALLALPAMLARRRPGLRSVLLFLLPVLAVWAVNALAGDPLTIVSSQGGVNLYIGNSRDADGITPFAPLATGAVAVPDDDLPYHDNVETASRAGYVAAGGEAGDPPSRVSSYWMGQALASVGGSPGRWILLEARKLLHLLSPVEVPGNYDPYYMRRLSPVLAALVWPPPLFGPLLLLWLLVPGALVVTLRGEAPGTAMRALAWAGLLSLGSLLFFVTARMRLPLVPFLLVWAAASAARRSRLSLRLAPVGLAAGMLLSLVTSESVARSGVNMEFYDGLAHYRDGQPERARELFLAAVQRSSARRELDMNGTEALYNLGVIAARRGRMAEAASWWRAALRRQPGHPAASAALEALGDAGPAGVDPLE